ncbi:MAG: gamma-glutamyltransferase [Ignavibacteriaceae bacterium]|nr:gamma-glutamyltransferase [Ignavibacteriaceae bacterium]
MYSVKKIFLSVLLLALVIVQIACNTPPQPVTAENGMVVSTSSYASKVGVEIIRKGGNAVDAAVAVGFALAVTYPSAGNLGGGGFMVIHLVDGKNITIDYREKAPLSAHRVMYLNEAGKFVPELSQFGTTSAGVPGSVAGLIFALNKYGTMTLAEVIQPAIDLARKGFKLERRDSIYLSNTIPLFSKYPSSMKIFTKDDVPYSTGALFIQSDLAWTLEQIKAKGKDGFYKGKVAELLVKQVTSLGGYFSLEDLEKYQPVEREPISGSYRGFEIISMPPPSSGGIALVQMLNVLENYDLKNMARGSSEYIHHIVEAMKYAYADRTYHLGDEDFYPVPKDQLISKEYAKSIFDRIESAKNKAVPSSEIKSLDISPIYESTETTHYSVYDSYGNAVSTTTTINSSFGSGIIVEGAGFLLNNEMDDFSGKPGVMNQFGLLGTEANSIQPEKRMLSSMTPTIILKDGEPFIVIGSPGGSQIITTVLQVMLNCIDFDMNIREAIEAPRIHHQWMPDSIFYEMGALKEEVRKELTEMGYLFWDADIENRIIGIAEGIMIDQSNKIIYGASDSRGGGLAVGY